MVSPLLPTSTAYLLSYMSEEDNYLLLSMEDFVAFGDEIDLSTFRTLQAQTSTQCRNLISQSLECLRADFQLPTRVHASNTLPFATADQSHLLDRR